MLDIILILIIVFSFISNYCAVRIWKKTNFVKMVYVEEGVSILLYTIAVFGTGIIFLLYFFKSSEVSNSWLLWGILLFFDIVMLGIFDLEATTCIYLDENVLYQKSIFLTKHIKITGRISITEKFDRLIVRDGNTKITINFRKLSGDTLAVVNRIKQLSMYDD